MRLIILAVVVLASFLQAAYAQTDRAIIWPAPLPITPGDMANYCVYESKVYSIGSGLCFGKVGYVCVPATGPATGSRAFWTGREDQVFPRPACN